jgi:type II secretory pathway pseudopilin PulG
MSKRARIYFLGISVFLIGLVYWTSWAVQVQNETRQAERLRMQQQEIESIKNMLREQKNQQSTISTPNAEEGSLDSDNNKKSGQKKQDTASSRPACASLVKDIHARYEKSLGSIQSDYAQKKAASQNTKVPGGNKNKAENNLKEKPIRAI